MSFRKLNQIPVRTDNGVGTDGFNLLKYRGKKYLDN